MNKNNLGEETSPYLLQHKNNPVHWQAWNERLYQEQNSAQKLLIISIGYSSCHWCHVMEKESFEDLEVAEYMNSHFINIKVDREEYPAVDALYLIATEMMTQQAGWPLNVVCLPDGRPIYGGTYHTKGQWLEVLNKIQSLFKTEPEQLHSFANRVEKGIQKVNRFSFTPNKSLFDVAQLKNEMDYWKQLWDNINGGDQTRQKFIVPSKWNYLLHYEFLFQDQEVKKHLQKSLTEIAESGLFDPIEGGFYRYTVDPEWKIPHFEKMLYDNAQCLSLYANAYKRFQKPLFKDRVEKTFSFLKERLESRSGGFYAAIDADNDEGEGGYYVYSKEELKQVAQNNFDLLLDYYQVELDDPFEKGNYHLRSKSVDELFLKKHALQNNSFERIKEKWTHDFKTILKNRNFPLTDIKIITSWNAMLCSAFVSCFESFGADYYLDEAKQLFDFIHKNLWLENQLMHTFQRGEAKIEGTLEDYAFTIQAALKLYKNTFEIHFLTLAERLTAEALQYFQKENSPFFTFTNKPTLLRILFKYTTMLFPLPTL